MSVMMVLQFAGDPSKLEELAASDPQGTRSIAEKAREHGVIAHRFYGADGRIMVVDEWPDEQSFHAFFGEMGERIRAMFESVGLQEQPHPQFWRKLETHDEVGWGA